MQATIPAAGKSSLYSYRNGQSSFLFGSTLSAHNPVTNQSSCGCAGQYYVKAMDWINDGTGHSGNITCPKKQCAVKIGTYSFSGLKCRCGKLFTPGY